VGDLEGHAEERSRALAVAVEIAHDPEHIDGNGQDGVQANGQKVIDPGPLEAGPVKALDVEDQEVGGQEKREDDDVLPERRNPLARVDGDDIGVKTKKVGIEKRDQDADHIAQNEEPDEA
jgi:hypothetical protein